jgi:hypothetical protein
MASVYALAAWEYDPSARRRFASCTISCTVLADDSARAEVDSESSKTGSVRIGGTLMEDRQVLHYLDQSQASSGRDDVVALSFSG